MKTRLLPWLVLIGAFLSARCAVPFDPAPLWQWMNPAPAGPLQSIVFAKGKFFAFGPHGNIATTIDGVHWRAFRMDGLSDIESVDAGALDVAYGGGKFLAFLGGEAATSTNGVDWVDAPVSVFNVSYGRRGFVGVQDFGYFGYPLYWDGATNWGWGNGAVYVRDVVYGHGRYVAVGIFGRASVSYNGRDWKTIQLKTQSPFVAVAFSRGRYVALTEGGEVFISSTGRRWRLCGIVPISTSPTLIAGQRGVHIIDSRRPGFQRWTVTLQGRISGCNLPVGIRSIARARGLSVAVGDVVATSHDERQWVVRSNDGAEGADILDLAADNRRRLMAVTQHREYGRVGSYLLQSVDGSNWVMKSDSLKGYSSIATDGEKFVAVSGDGIETWVNGSIASYTPRTNGFTRVRYVRDRFFALAKNITLQSLDGETWSSEGCPAGPFTDATFGNGLYVLMSPYETYTSPDGVTWIYLERYHNNGFEHVFWTGTEFLGSNSSWIFHSPDLMAWDWGTWENGPFTGFLRVDNHVIAYGFGGSLVSHNGTNVIFKHSLPLKSVNAMVVAGQYVYAAGNNGAILRTPLEALTHWLTAAQQ